MTQETEPLPRSRDLRGFVAEVESARRRLSPRNSLLVAVTGIDGAGKGFVAERLRSALLERGMRAGVIGVDGWLNLPSVRFGSSGRTPGEHFYRHALRFPELFARLVEPLRRARSIRVEADFAEETAQTFRPHVHEYEDLDVILLEGIFLLRRALQPRYDLSLWVDCSFETALERAVARAQEGLAPDETERAYRAIYFPAQELHLLRDRPREAAGAILANDPRLSAAVLR